MNYSFWKELEEGVGGETSEVIYNSIIPACLEGISGLVQEGKIEQFMADDLLDAIRYQMTGILLYYSNRRHPADYGALLESVNRQLTVILDRA